MRAVCAWCGTVIEAGEAGDTRVSHGICPRCARRFLQGDLRYAVLPHDRSFLFPEIESAFQAVRHQVILTAAGDGVGTIVPGRAASTLARDRRKMPCPVVAPSRRWSLSPRPASRLGRGSPGIPNSSFTRPPEGRSRSPHIKFRLTLRPHVSRPVLQRIQG
jgi:hypothetical protein